MGRVARLSAGPLRVERRTRSTMHVAVVTGPGAVELRNEPIPRLGPEDVLIEVGTCGLCTMERRLFDGTKPIYPVAPGHEAGGRVIEVGQAVASLPGSPQIGDLVTMDLLTRCGTCRMCRRGRSALCKRPQGGTLSDGTISMGAGLAEVVRVAAAQTYCVGEIPVEHAAMGEPLACVVHSARLSGFRPGDRVAVVGAGYMGRLHLALCRAWGASCAGMVDVDEQRRAEASAAGADWVAGPDGLTGWLGQHDVVFVTAGTPGAVELALDLCDDAGAVVLYGAFAKDVMASVGADRIHHHELSIIGAFSQEPEDWRTAAGLLQSGALAADLDRLVTARYGLADVADALALTVERPVYRVMVGQEAERMSGSSRTSRER
ncbi:MAG: alcohol dehydrogenase catalytic domain-containing protein [Acidimicrobiaceae bacterium]|nr:alcohol dehydrogenase catalytic domain-containing protein [Acidimicrobiaceae bacterium]